MASWVEVLFTAYRPRNGGDSPLRRERLRASATKD